VIEERQYIQDKLYDVFTAILEAREITGIPVIQENSEGPRPKAPFLTIEFRSTAGLGSINFSKVKREPGNDGIQRMSQPQRRNMTLHGFGERAIDALETIKTQLAADKWADELYRRCLVIPQVFETLETPQGIDTTRENAASFDFDVTYTRVVETTPGYIEHAELNSTYIGG
jgi:hypothetical protein